MTDKTVKAKEGMTNEKIGILILVTLASLILGYLLGYGNKPESVKETQYVLQECKPSDLDYAKYHIQKQKDMKELCPQGGQWIGDNGTQVRCYDR